MYRVLRRYNLNNGLVKYVSFPISTRLNDDIDKNIIHNDKKLSNNLCRAKTKIKEYVLCNDFKYFVTITCNNKKINRYDLHQFRNYVAHVIRYYRKKTGLSCKYVLIPEKHKKGGYHLHGVLDESFLQAIYINQNGYDSLHIFDNLGFSSVEEIKSPFKVANYITKYVSKDFAFRGLGEHLYFCSRGLKKPIKIDDIVYNNEYFDNKFFTFKNDFCYSAYYIDIKLDSLLKKRDFYD